MAPITRTPGRARPALRGALTALVTPFTPDGALDEPAFRRLVSWQVLSGIDGLVPCGTTGESPTLSQAERVRLIQITVEVAAEGRLKRAMELANKLGARRALILGDNEISAGLYALKDMASGEQLNLSREELIAKLTN